jgi:hypothetical protein
MFVAPLTRPARSRWAGNYRSDGEMGSIPIGLTIFSSALAPGAKYLKNGAVAAVRLNRFPSNAIPSGKNSCWSRCF